MTTSDVIRIARRYLMLIMVSTAIGVALRAVLFAAHPRMYAADAKVFVSTASSGDVADLQLGTSFSEQRAEMHAELISTPAVLEPVMEELEWSVSTSALANRVDAEAIPGTSLLELTARASGPRQSAALTDAVVQSVTDLSGTLEGLEGVPQGLVTVTVLDNAEVPVSPVQPDLLMDLGGGLAAGLVVGVGAALFRHSVDTRVCEESDIAGLGDLLVVRAPVQASPSGKESRRAVQRAAERDQAPGALSTHLWLTASDQPHRSVAFKGASLSPSHIPPMRPLVATPLSPGGLR